MRWAGLAAAFVGAELPAAGCPPGAARRQPPATRSSGLERRWAWAPLSTRLGPQGSAAALLGCAAAARQPPLCTAQRSRRGAAAAAAGAALAARKGVLLLPL